MKKFKDQTWSLRRCTNQKLQPYAFAASPALHRDPLAEIQLFLVMTKANSHGCGVIVIMVIRLPCAGW
jgi:hypothetical protein